jgi:uncharacterized protein (TIGR03437 family)
MVGPISLLPVFTSIGVQLTSVTLQTDPQELTVIVDSVRLTPPVTLEWGWSTVHHIAVDPNQTVRGVAYVFQSWSDGGDFSHDVPVPSPSPPITLTAHFVPAHTVRFSTSPPNLKLTVDGRQDWVNYGFAWLPGSVHRVSAPTSQTDALGRRYRFVSWSDGQPASFDYKAGAPAGDLQVVATYQLLGQATITTNPANLPVEVDGAACLTPCVVERDAGASVRVTAAPVLNNIQRSRLVFRGWTDASSGNRAIQLLPEPKTYLANYAPQSLLSMAAEPSGGAAIVADPASSDGYYDTGSLVLLTAMPALGFRIQRWSGDITGTASTAAVLVDGPKDILLLLDRMPAISPSGIRNAATGGSTDDVAPGSLISIFGANLAPGTAIGPSNPLAQTLQGVTVRVGDALLPLIFVSATQINAQLTSNIEPGLHTLIVRVEGWPEVAVPLKVARNAPGLFSSGSEDAIVGAFFRANGEAITRESPAQAGEVISLLATGLGPYRFTPPDGFVVEESASYSLIDPAEVVVDGKSLVPVFAGRSHAGAGIDVIRFAVPVNSTESASLPMQVIVNGRSSNVVPLPVRRSPIQQPSTASPER